MKVATLVGARPQFIKAAVVSRAFREHRRDVTEILVHTGQHFDANMSDVFFEELDIPSPLTTWVSAAVPTARTPGG